MNTNVKNISEIVDDIKEKLTDYQYKTIMDNLMALNNEKEEDEEQEEAAVEEEVEEETNEEEVEELVELSKQIMFLNINIPTINDDELKATYTRRLNLLQHLFSIRIDTLA